MDREICHLPRGTETTPGSVGVVIKRMLTLLLCHKTMNINVNDSVANSSFPCPHPSPFPSGKKPMYKLSVPPGGSVMWQTGRKMLL